MKRRLRVSGVVAVTLVGLAAAVGNLGAYATTGHVWGVNQIPYYVNPNSVWVSQAAAIADAQQAAADWNTQAGVSVRLSYAGTTNATSLVNDHTNNVFFRNDGTGHIAETYWWWDGTGHLVDADIVFHEGSKFYAGGTGCAGDGYYIANTLVHEFGHLLGLNHSEFATATMWGTSGACETSKESLDPDDLAGIQSLYPKSSSTSSPPASPTQLTATADAANPTAALSLTWINTATNANGYRVERSPDGLSFGQIVQLGSSAASYVDSGLNAGTAYYYRVSAYNGAGSSAFSNVATGQTQAFSTAPGMPSTPSPSNGASGIGSSTTLKWTSSNAQQYDVYISGALFASGLTSPSITVSSLASGSTYSWNVVATNMVGSTTGPAWSFTTSTPQAKKGGRKK